MPAVPLDQPVTLVLFSADPDLIERIQAVCQRLGYSLEYLTDVESIKSSDFKDGEFRGSGAALLEWITRLQPALLIFDLEASAFPWQQWLPLIKADPATRRRPLLAIGSSRDRQSRQRACALGADACFTRPTFYRSLERLIRAYVRPIPYETYQQECSGALSSHAIRGIELFNCGEYFEAHEILEIAWNEETGPGRELYRSLLQAAVCYLQIERRNYRGALKMFLRLRQWLDPLPSHCRGVNIQQLKQEIAEVFQKLVALGPDRLRTIDMDEFKQRYFRPIQYQN